MFGFIFADFLIGFICLLFPLQTACKDTSKNQVRYQDNKYFKQNIVNSVSNLIFAKQSFNKMDVDMKPKVSIIMGSTSDLPVMEAAAKFLDQMEIPFEINALSAHRTPKEVEEFATNADQRGIEVIIAGAGMAAHLPGVIAAMTPLPVIGVPIKAALDGIDAALAMLQMPPGIPVATVAINGALNAAILALQIMATADDGLKQKMIDYKESLKQKIVKANQDLAEVKYKFKV